MSDVEFFEKCIIYAEEQGYKLIVLDRPLLTMCCLDKNGDKIICQIPEELKNI